jgi:hypothetical protein
MRKIIPLVLACAGLFTPFLASAADSTAASYQFQRQGIFGCNLNGAYAMSVGSMSAAAGAYVPVADATVELNTGILVYKECVLREVVDRERESAMSAFFKQTYNGIQTGRNGNALYVKNEGSELLLNVSDPVFLAFLKDGTLSKLNPSLQAAITRALAQNYEGETRLPQNATLKCPYQGDLNAWWSGQTAFDFSTFWNASQPQCDPIGAYYLAQNVAQTRIAQAMQYQQDQWNWGQGFYARTDNAQNPLMQQILTPSSVVAQSFEQMLQSPVQQLQSANDIGQMIGALYAGVSTQVVGDSQGLSGLSQSVGGQPSYLDQVAAESAQGVQNAAVNAALQILQSAQQVEGSYLQTVSAIGASLSGAIGQLRNAENQCWNIVISGSSDGTSGGSQPHVCTSALSSTNTCTDASGNTLKVATSTAFSQAVIDANITPLATVASSNIQASQTALTKITNLINGVTNTSSLDAQRLALQQLDSLVAQHALHTPPDLQTVNQQLSDVQGSMQTLVTNTVQSWADSTDPNAGWCNVNNPAVITKWDQAWKQ